MFPYNDIEFRRWGTLPHCFLPEIIDPFAALFVVSSVNLFDLRKALKKNFENDTLYKRVNAHLFQQEGETNLSINESTIRQSLKVQIGMGSDNHPLLFISLFSVIGSYLTSLAR